MVGMPDFLARFLTRFLARFLTRFSGQDLGTEHTMYSMTGTDKYSVQYSCDGEIHFYSSAGRETTENKNYVLKTPMYKTSYIKQFHVLSIPCIKTTHCNISTVFQVWKLKATRQPSRVYTAGFLARDGRERVAKREPAK